MSTVDERTSDYGLVASAIEYIRDNKLGQPTLDDVAQHAGVSPSHMQRVFTRWAGVSPKRFLQFLTIEHAKQLLDESRSVMDVAYESGLSGPSRLHDLFVGVDGVTPGEYKKLGEGLVIQYGRHVTPFGECLIAVTDRGVCGMYFVDGDSSDAIADLRTKWPEAKLVEDSAATGRIVDSIFHGLSGRSEPLSLFLKGTNFQLKVWEALLSIPAGAVVSYGEIAQAIGSPTSGRAVGNAVGSNPIAYLIPCHRVIRSSGAISSYRWGATRKLAILGWEAAQTELMQAAD